MTPCQRWSSRSAAAAPARRRRRRRAGVRRRDRAAPARAVQGPAWRRSASRARRARRWSCPAATGPTVVAVGMGDAGASSTAAVLRNAAAALARAAGKRSSLATALADVEPSVDAGATAGQAVAEGCVLGTYRFVGLQDRSEKRRRSNGSSLLGRRRRRGPPSPTGADAGRGHRRRGRARPRPGQHPARAPHRRATSPRAPSPVGRPSAGLDVEVFDERTIAEMGCGGMLGVNRGQHRTAPAGQAHLHARATPSGTVALVGKGVMYDSGGISLKPTDGMHVNDEDGHERRRRRAGRHVACCRR